MRFTEEAQAGTVRLTVAGVRSEVHRGGSGGTVRLSLAGVKTYEGEIHRGGSGRHC